MDEKHKNILIVDDEPNMCWALGHLLENKGFTVVKALSGQEALACIKTERFQFAFLDAKLPDMDGLELVRRIREVDATIRIVMLSGYFYEHDAVVQEAQTRGLIAGFIAKPFLHDEVLEAIKGGS